MVYIGVHGRRIYISVTPTGRRNYVWENQHCPMAVGLNILIGLVVLHRRRRHRHRLFRA
jgi:hypothetical protein